MAERTVEKNIALFQEEKPSLESYWRSIVLFGRNTGEIVNCCGLKFESA